MTPPISLLDTSSSALEDTCAAVAAWIRARSRAG
jgi:hypothetical protein